MFQRKENSCTPISCHEPTSNHSKQMKQLSLVFVKEDLRKSKDNLLQNLKMSKDTVHSTKSFETSPVCSGGVKLQGKSS